MPSFETVTVSVEDHIATVRLNRPEKLNAMNLAMWNDIRSAFQHIDATPEIRVAILEGEGKAFTAGIDLQMMMGLGPQIRDDCDGRTRENLRRVADAWFTIKEIDIGMTADVGTLQRLPKLIGDGMARELAYTARKVDAAEAKEIRLVNRVYDTPEALSAGVRAIAAEIAAKAPLAIRGVKEMITYARDHSVADGLNYNATWNAAMLMSADLQEAMMSGMSKRPPAFKD